MTTRTVCTYLCSFRFFLSYKGPRFLTLFRTSDTMHVSLLLSLSVKWYLYSRIQTHYLTIPKHCAVQNMWIKHYACGSDIMRLVCMTRMTKTNEHIPCVVVVVCSSLTSLSTNFQSYHDGVWLRQGAQSSLLLCSVTAVSCPRHVA